MANYDGVKVSLAGPGRGVSNANEVKEFRLGPMSGGGVIVAWDTDEATSDTCWIHYQESDLVDSVE